MLNVKTLPAPNNMVGYMLFNDHIATAESELIAAINNCKAANITDLVLDIRYNGGGYLDIASELAYMIGGSAITPGAYFERLQFNDRNPFNPVTTPFHTTSQNFDVPAGQALPTLNLSRVYVLTTADTCSASEAIVNGLRGAGVAVNLIGGTTCGKPYGFYPRDNCSTTYFTIQFKGVNNAGFGDYPEGFTPTCPVPTTSRMHSATRWKRNSTWPWACAPTVPARRWSPPPANTSSQPSRRLETACLPARSWPATPCAKTASTARIDCRIRPCATCRIAGSGAPPNTCLNRTADDFVADRASQWTDFSDR